MSHNQVHITINQLQSKPKQMNGLSHINLVNGQWMSLSFFMTAKGWLHRVELAYLTWRLECLTVEK